jgi:hypothetical protein
VAEDLDAGGCNVNAVARALRGVVKAIHSFLVGDTPGLFVAALCVVGAAFALADERVAAAVVLPGIAAVGVVVSAARGRSALSGATRGRERRRRGWRAARQDGA